MAKTTTKVSGTEQCAGVAFEANEIPHTIGHEDCPACQASDKLLDLDDVKLSALTFREASPLWMELRKRKRTNLKPRTHEATQQYLDQLEKFFGDLVLQRITPGHMREYQIARAANAMTIKDGDGHVRVEHPWNHPAGNSMINHEICALGQMLARCELWKRLKPNYSPLPIPSWSPREVLTEEQEEHLFKVAADDPEVELAYWVAAITNNTSAAGCELRGLRLENLFLRESKPWHGIESDPSEIYIPAHAVKNNSRPRKIALNLTARWAVEKCYRRALKLGSTKPEHFLFPFRKGPGKYDPERPASRWFLRNSWNRLREKAELPDLCPHDLRHQCITRLLERGVDPETVRAIAGHVTPKMMEYYSHIRRQAKYAAVMAIEPSRAGKGKKPPLSTWGAQKVTRARRFCP